MWRDGSPILQKEGEFECNTIDQGLKQASLVMALRYDGNTKSSEEEEEGEEEWYMRVMKELKIRRRI